ncbi:MAG: hypothetical protein F6K47_29475 [Symploca sp. SIO2E6]|nr:hypothetical protein [Symploca sp. SIO2E6]
MGIGNWELGIGNWELGIGNWEWSLQSTSASALSALSQKTQTRQLNKFGWEGDYVDKGEVNNPLP